jgi:hypothetical protein
MGFGNEPMHACRNLQIKSDPSHLQIPSFTGSESDRNHRFTDHDIAITVIATYEPRKAFCPVFGFPFVQRSLACMCLRLARATPSGYAWLRYDLAAPLWVSNAPARSSAMLYLTFPLAAATLNHEFTPEYWGDKFRRFADDRKCDSPSCAYLPADMKWVTS